MQFKNEIETSIFVLKEYGKNMMIELKMGDLFVGFDSNDNDGNMIRVVQRIVLKMTLLYII